MRTAVGARPVIYRTWQFWRIMTIVAAALVVMATILAGAYNGVYWGGAIHRAVIAVWLFILSVFVPAVMDWRWFNFARRTRIMVHAVGATLGVMMLVLSLLCVAAYTFGVPLVPVLMS